MQNSCNRSTKYPLWHNQCSQWCSLSQRRLSGMEHTKVLCYFNASALIWQKAKLQARLLRSSAQPSLPWMVFLQLLLSSTEWLPISSSGSLSWKMTLENLGWYPFFLSNWKRQQREEWVSMLWEGPVCPRLQQWQHFRAPILPCGYKAYQLFVSRSPVTFFFFF